MKRIAVSSICALAFLMMLSGCASDFQRESVLDARAEDPQGLISGIPAQGEKVCLAAGSFHSTELDISVHRALRDRGYIVTFLKCYEEPNPRRCRFFVAISGSEMSTPGDLPASITLDYRDLFTGETQRSVWRRDPGTTASGWRHASQKASPNALLAGAWGDLDLITRNLVDQLFPEQH